MEKAKRAFKKYRRYTEDQVQSAILQSRSTRSSIRDAARQNDVPESTLRDRLKGRKCVSGPATILSFDQEERLVKWIIAMARMGFGQTRSDVCHAVKTLLDTSGTVTPFLENRPGQTWYYSFLKRHPDISLRQPQPLIRPRAILTEEATNKWFADLEEYLREEGGIDILTQPARIFNADESGFCLQPKGAKVLAEKGSKTVCHFAGDNRTQVTVLAGICADGGLLPPMIVFAGKRFGYNPLQGFPEAHLGRSDNGWMDAILFCEWLKQVFEPYLVKHNTPRPVLLLVDGHSSHTTFEAGEFCAQKGIILYCLLAHASHLLQPCDRGLFGPLKASWRAGVHEYMNLNPGCCVTKQTFSAVFRKAWEKAATEVNVQQGFSASGIFPFNPSKGAPKSSVVANSKPLTGMAAREGSTTSVTEDSTVPGPSRTTVSTGPSTGVIAREGSTTSSTEASTSTVPGPSRMVAPTGGDPPNLSPSTADVAPLDAVTPACPIPGAVLVPVWVTPQMIQEAVFKLPEIQQQKKKECTTLCAFPKAVSSKQVREMLAEKRSQREEKERAKRARLDARLQKQKAPINHLDSESTSSESSSEDESSDAPTLPKVGDFVLVKFCTKKSWQCHIGKIVEIDGSDVSSQFLRRQSGSRLRFHNAEEETWVHNVDDIVSVLPEPLISGTKVRTSLTFDFDFSKFNMG